MHLMFLLKLFKIMSLYSKCLNVLARENVIDMHRNNLELIPLDVKTGLLALLCKRGLIKNVSIFNKLINLRVTLMDLSETEVTDEFLNSLQICEYLKKLDLSLSRKQSRKITSEALKSLFQHLHFLRTLHLPNCKEMNDQVMETISFNCKLLRQLHIPHTSITDHSLHLLSQHLKTLSVLNVSGNKVTDSGVEYLVSGYTCHTLLELSINNTEVSSEAVTLILQNLKNLKIFDLSSLNNCEAISNFALRTKQIFWTV